MVRARRRAWRLRSRHEDKALKTSSKQHQVSQNQLLSPSILFPQTRRSFSPNNSGWTCNSHETLPWIHCFKLPLLPQFPCQLISKTNPIHSCSQTTFPGSTVPWTQKRYASCQTLRYQRELCGHLRRRNSSRCICNPHPPIKSHRRTHPRPQRPNHMSMTTSSTTTARTSMSMSMRMRMKTTATIQTRP